MEVTPPDLAQIMTTSALEIRADGRAGSGVVLTMQSLASMAAADPNFFVQEWPFFSSARKGAPTRGFLRLSRNPIVTGSPIAQPHISILMDPGVTAFVDFAQGVLPGSIFVVNTPMDPHTTAARYHLTGRVYTIDGDGLAMRYLKKPLGNISVFALLSQIIPGLDPAHAESHLIHMLEKRRLPKALIAANRQLFAASADQVHSATCADARPNEHQAKTFTGYGELAPGAQSRLRLSKQQLTSAYARTGFRLQFDDPHDLCNGCGHCIINCPENIIEFRPDPSVGVKVTGAQISQYCKLCHECIAICPKKLFSEVAS